MRTESNLACGHLSCQRPDSAAACICLCSRSAIVSPSPSSQPPLIIFGGLVLAWASQASVACCVAVLPPPPRPQPHCPAPVLPRPARTSSNKSKVQESVNPRVTRSSNKLLLGQRSCGTGWGSVSWARVLHACESACLGMKQLIFSRRSLSRQTCICHVSAKPYAPPASLDHAPILLTALWSARMAHAGWSLAALKRSGLNSIDPFPRT